MNFKTLLPGAVLLVLTACAQQEEPGPIYAEPVFDKYGNPSCRPPDQPVGGVWSADLPLCAALTGAAAAAANGDGTTPGVTPPPPPPPPPGEPVPPYRNQNQNTNQNTNQNQGG